MPLIIQYIYPLFKLLTMIFIEGFYIITADLNDKYKYNETYSVCICIILHLLPSHTKEKMIKFHLYCFHVNIMKFSIEDYFNITHHWRICCAILFYLKKYVDLNILHFCDYQQLIKKSVIFFTTYSVIWSDCLIHNSGSKDASLEIA